MNKPSRNADPIEELQYALAEGFAEEPPTALGAAIAGVAVTSRPPGSPVDPAPPIAPAEGFRRAARSLDAVLDALGKDEWGTAAIRDLDVQGLVGHLIAVERDFQHALDDPDGPQADADHVVSTDPTAAEQSGRSPAETLHTWRGAMADTFDALEALEAAPARMADEVALYGMRLAIAPLLIVRTFELWTHEEDIRRTLGQPLQAPDASTLTLMTTLGIGMLGSGLARIDRSGDGRGQRIVLTGPGGGTWQTSLARRGPSARADTASGPVDVRIVVDAVDFCRLLANRIDPADLVAVVSGDGALARDVFAGAAALALD